MQKFKEGFHGQPEGMMPETYIAELHNRIQFLVDNWPTPLEDGAITFPDGYTWDQSE